MKKNLILAAAVFALASCNNSMQNTPGKGCNKDKCKKEEKCCQVETPAAKEVTVVAPVVEAALATPAQVVQAPAPVAAPK